MIGSDIFSSTQKNFLFCFTVCYVTVVAFAEIQSYFCHLSIY